MIHFSRITKYLTISNSDCRLLVAASTVSANTADYVVSSLSLRHGPCQGSFIGSMITEPSTGVKIFFAGNFNYVVARLPHKVDDGSWRDTNSSFSHPIGPVNVNSVSLGNTENATCKDTKNKGL